MSDVTPEAPTTDVEVEDQPTPQQSGAPQEGTSAPEAPEMFSEGFDPSTLDEPLQERYRQMQADYTRKTQELAEQRKQAESVTALFTDLRSEDPVDRQNALKWLAQNGLDEQDVAAAFDWEIQSDDEEPLDPNDPAAIRQEFETYRAQQEAEREQANQRAWAEAEDQRINTELDELGNGALSQRSRDLIFRNALAASQIGLTEGIDIKRAFDEYEAEFTDRQRAWRDGKQTAQPVGAGGQAATEVPDTDTHEGRVAYMMSRLQPGPQ